MWQLDFLNAVALFPVMKLLVLLQVGRGVSIHRTDCINIINLPDFERGRLIEASWAADEGKQDGKYMTENCHICSQQSRYF